MNDVFQIESDLYIEEHPVYQALQNFKLGISNYLVTACELISKHLLLDRCY
jgi:hypothetical protein